jgi:NADPH:quinone reductase-like Zn-dependent oxidoreductase
VVEAEVPPPGPGEVTIEVRAAGVNPIDYKPACWTG